MLLADLDSLLKSAALFIWIFGVIVWCSFGVIEHADHLAERLGEPIGTLMLTLSIVLIEVILIGAVMLGDKAAPTVGRDAMMSVMMIILNGIVGLGLLIGGWRHREQSYNLQGAAAYLAVIIPFDGDCSRPAEPHRLQRRDGTLTAFQAVAFSMFTLILYGIFLAIQTGRHRSFLCSRAAIGCRGWRGRRRTSQRTRHCPLYRRHTLMLVFNMLPIVLLSKSFAKLIDHGIIVLNAPVVLSGFLIALIVFTPKSFAALRAAYVRMISSGR